MNAISRVLVIGNEVLPKTARHDLIHVQIQNLLVVIVVPAIELVGRVNHLFIADS